jgi:hypothetical protein
MFILISVPKLTVLDDQSRHQALVDVRYEFV